MAAFFGKKWPEMWKVLGCAAPFLVPNFAEIAQASVF